MSPATLFMAFIMLCEGGGQGVTGMRPIGHVIVNRGGTIRETLHKPRAFACATPDWHARMLRIAALPHTHPEWRRWQEAKALAVRIRTGHDRDPTHGAQFYHAVRSPAVWRHQMQLVATIGGQRFYRMRAKG